MMGEIRKFLEDRVTFMTRHMGELAAPIERFVLEFGTESRGSPFPHERMTPKQCFYNAAMYGIRQGLWYVEGYGELPNVPIPFHHAWCENGSGVIFDPTWEKPEERWYMGVRFKATEALKLGMRRGEFSLLDSTMGPRIEFIEKQRNVRNL